MASFDDISKSVSELKHRIKTDMTLSSEEIDGLLGTFAEIKKCIELNYLSHLKSAIEDIVNEKLKNDIIAQLEEEKSKTGRSADDIEIIKKMLGMKQFRPCSIILKAIPVKTKKKACTRIVNRSAIIYYDSTLEIKSLRICIAHELGHVVIRELSKERDKMKDQELANFFAFLAILDKDMFYKNNIKDLVHHSDIELLNSILHLLPLKSA